MKSWPSLEEALAAIAHAEHHEWRLLFRTLLETACRYMEIATLTSAQVRDGCAVIEAHELPDGTIWLPKTRSSVRSIRLPETLYAELRGQADGERLLFFPGRRRPPYHSSANHHLARACEAAGVPRFSTHGFRHVRAVQALAAGADVNTVRAILGHRSIRMTVRYLEDVPVAGQLPAVEAEAVPNPAAAQYLTLLDRR